ncbi:MAG TPA: flagellar type III secretion system pore protein FliP [Steroidobacteraceae bacterium]|nr:flagellar type III secretion system pore protein FliP [Steroidobacteraceae bacterium]
MARSRRHTFVRRVGMLLAVGAVICILPHAAAHADALGLPGVQFQLVDAHAKPQQVATAIRLLALLTVLSLAPAILIVMTSFMRTIIVLSMLRHASGMEDTPPNAVLVSLALILTMFTMTPVLEQANTRAFTPYMNGQISGELALQEALQPFRVFMIRQTREQDVRLMLSISKAPAPATFSDLRTVDLIPAFMLSELKTAFQIGFVIFLPFLLLDLIVSSILMAMGMLMVPPMMISLPLKILMFVLIDGWNLVVGALLGSFH